MDIKHKKQRNIGEWAVKCDESGGREELRGVKN